MWPFDRLARLFGRGKEPDSGTTARGELTSPAESNPAGDPGAHPAGEAAWRSVPAVQRVVQAMPLTTAPAKFEAGLVSWQSVAALEPLGHAVSPDAPSGSVTGLARPVAVQRSVDMPVRTTEAKPPRRLGGIARPAETTGFEAASVQQDADEAGGLVGNDALTMTTTDPVAAPSEPVGSGGASVALPLVQRTTTEAASQPAARATAAPGAAAGRDLASGSAGTTSSATEPAMGGMPVAVQRSATAMPPGTPRVPTAEAPHSAATEPAPGTAAEAPSEPVTGATSESAAGSVTEAVAESAAGTTSGLVGDTALASTAAAEAAQSSAAGAPVVQRSASGALPLVTDRHTTGMPAASPAGPGAEPALDRGVESVAPTTGLSPMSTAVPAPAVQRSASAGSAGSGPVTPSRAGGSRPNSFISASGVELPVVTVQLHAVQPTPAPAPSAALVEQATEATEVTEVSETPQAAAAEAESSSGQADPEPVPTLQPIQRAISEPVTAEPPQPRRLGLGEPMHVVPRSSPPPPDTDPFEIRPVLGDQPVVQRALATAGPADSASTASPATPEPSAPAMPYVEARSNAPEPMATTPAPDVEPEPRPDPVLDPALEPASAPNLPLAIDQPALAIQPVLGDRGFAPLSLQRSAEPNGHAIESVHHQTPGAGTMPASGAGTGPSPVARRPNVQRSMGSPAVPGSGRGSVRPAAANGGSAAPVFVQRFDLPGLPSAPGMPALPSAPSMPSMPSMPALPGMPTVPGMPALPGLPNVPAMPVTPAGVPSGLTDAASTVTDSATSAVSGLTENVTNGLSDAASAATSAMDPVVAATGSATVEGLGPGGAPGPSGGSPAGQAGAAGLAAVSPSDLDELSRQLYDRIRSRLRAELRLDRERAGLLTDPYR